MKAHSLFLVSLFLVMSHAAPTIASPSFDGVLSLSPVEEHSCLAVALPVTPGQPLLGISWIHNDESVAFPNLLIMEGQVGVPPDLSQTSLVLQEITGASLAWGDVTFDTPITSSTNLVYAVFQLPAFAERTGEGLGGGPGIGYVQQKGAGAAYVSVDGVSWTRLHPDFSMAVTTTVAMGKVASTQPLAELQATRLAGWWDELDVGSGSEDALAAADETPIVSADQPLVIMPNPFNPRTTIAFFVETPGRVTIDVYDLRGRRVRSLQQGNVSAGAHEVVWTGVDERGASVASGVYFLRLSTPDGVHMKRAALVR
jgi:FlgD Ig-like domain